MRDDDTDIEALPASVSFRFVSFMMLATLIKNYFLMLSQKLKMIVENL